MTGFITDEHPDGSYTVFVPTAPNPTTGFVFHLKAGRVHPVSVGVDEAFRSIIACGAGSGRILQEYFSQTATGNTKKINTEMS